MSERIPTLDVYLEYIESLDRPLDIAAIIAEGSERRTTPASPGTRFGTVTREFDALQPVNSKALVADLVPAEAERRGRWLVAAAAAMVAVVLVVAVLQHDTEGERIRTGVPAGTRPADPSPVPPSTVSPQPGFDALIRGATPSTPKEGQLVAAAWRPGVGVSYLYADGRLIWLEDVDGTSHWVQQRLTPEGVERIRKEFLVSGLFDPREAIAGPEPSEYLGPRVQPLGCRVCVRHGGLVLSRDVKGMTADEDLIVDRLAMAPSSLPVAEWAEPEVKAYVPPTYAVCFVAASPRTSPSVGPDPSTAVNALPSRAARLIRGREPAGDLGMGGASCFQVPTRKAAALANELVAAFGAADTTETIPGAASFEITAVVDGSRSKSFGIQFWQLLPDGQLAYYYPAKH